MDAKPTSPPLRYYGANWRLAPWIISHFPPHRVYVECFGGGASVLLQKERSPIEIYNELNSEITDFFRVLRDPESSARLEKLLELTPHSRNEFDAAFERSPDPVENARRLLFLSIAGHGTAAVSTKKRTGFSAYECDAWRKKHRKVSQWLDVPGRIGAYRDRLRGVLIENRPAIEIMRQQDGPDVLFYLDPPYVHETRTGSKKAYAFEMTADEHRQLADVARSVKGMVIVSGYACDLYDQDLYRGWRTEDTEEQTNSLDWRTERLWISPNIRPKQRGLFDWEL